MVKNPENLRETKGPQERFEAVLNLNVPLATAYGLKEGLRQLWEQPGKQQARMLLDDWISRAHASGSQQLRQMANTLSPRREGDLAYHDVPIETGSLQGTNTKIQLLKRQAFGFPEPEFFKRRIYSPQHSRRQPIGSPRDANVGRAEEPDFWFVCVR